jgi:hypothetical protein
MSILLALLFASTAVAAPRLSQDSPAEMPQGAALAKWERFAGQAQAGAVVVVYELWVNPRRPGLYEITRYRGFRVTPEGVRDDPNWREILLWNPGPDEPLRCFERAADRWERIPPHTDRLRDEMLRAMQVYGLYRREHGLRSFGE